MAPAFRMQAAGNTPSELNTEAAVTLEQDKEGFHISRSALTLTASVPNLDQATFDRLAKVAKIESGTVAWAGLGIAEIAARVGGLIRQGRPLPVVLSALCQLFDATVKGLSSSVLLLDRTDTRVRNDAVFGLPASHMKQLAARAAWPGFKLYEVSPILSLTGEP